MACYNIASERAVMRGTEVQILSTIVRALQDGFALEHRDLPVSHTQTVHHLKLMQEDASETRTYGYEGEKRDVAKHLLACINEYFGFPIKNLSLEALSALLPGTPLFLSSGVGETEMNRFRIRQQLQAYLEFLETRNKALKIRLELEEDSEMQTTMNEIYRAKALSGQLWMKRDKIADKKKLEFNDGILQELSGAVLKPKAAEAVMLQDHEEAQVHPANEDEGCLDSQGENVCERPAAEGLGGPISN